MTDGPKIQKKEDRKNELYCFVPNIWSNLHMVNFNALIGHMVFIYLVVHFWSNWPVSNKCWFFAFKRVGSSQCLLFLLPWWWVQTCWVFDQKVRPLTSLGLVHWLKLLIWRVPCSGKLRRPRWTVLEVPRWFGPWLFGQKRMGNGKQVNKAEIKIKVKNISALLVVIETTWIIISLFLEVL